MDDGAIKIDSVRGKVLGFTSDKFSGYLWKRGNYVYISFIISLQRRRGNLSQLFQAIQSQGYGVKVPTPSNDMKKICQKYGFTATKEWFKEAKDWCEVWRLPPKK